MDSLKEPEIEIRFAPSVKVTEKYSPDVTFDVLNKKPKLMACNIGNSGLFVRLFDNDDNLDFVFDYYPNFEPSEKNRSTISSIFGSALLSFRNWLNNPDNKKIYNPENKKLLKFANNTNEKMANFANQLFSKNDHPEMVDIIKNGSNHYLKIDIEKFCKLPENDTLIQYLKKLDQRTKDVLLTYNKDQPFE